MNKQLYKILSYYLGKAGIFFEKSKLKQLITSHPHHNSLYAMVDTLDELNIENVALRVDIKGLAANGFPVIVFLEKAEKKFVVVDNIIDGQVHYYNAETGYVIESLDKFEEKWSGVALYAAQNEIQAELERKKTSSKNSLQWRNFLTVAIMVSCAGIWSFSIDWSYTLFFLLSLCVIGLAVSILLAMHEFGETNRLLHKVCHLNRITNCNEVLQSSAAKLFGWLSMSDIGLCYFIGSIVSLMIAGVTQHLETVISWLLVISLCSFPYTLFSLSYQIFKVKKICPLCLAVIGVLWAEIGLAVFCWEGLTFIPLSLVPVFSLITGFALPIIIWSYVKPLWKEYNRIRTYEYNYVRLKRMPAVIRAMISTEPTYSMDYIPEEIHLGTVDAPIHLTVVMSLFCKPCSNTWNILNRWLSTYPGLLQLTMRFSGYNSNHTTNTELIDALIGIYTQSGNDAFCKALTDWNECRDSQQWKEKYFSNKPISPNPLALKIAQWQHTISISAVPTVFVGDRIFRYALNDLEYLLKELELLSE